MADEQYGEEPEEAFVDAGVDLDGSDEDEVFTDDYGTEANYSGDDAPEDY